MTLTSVQRGTLAALANGIIPSDELDGGAGAVNAGPRIAEKIAAGLNASLYLKGLDLAESLAVEIYNVAPRELSAAQIHQLLIQLRDALPGFFKQLRMDVSAIYLSDPDVWRRIGFPGPSTAAGGYPDFAGRQVAVYGRPVGERGAGDGALSEPRRES